MTAHTTLAMEMWDLIWGAGGFVAGCILTALSMSWRARVQKIVGKGNK